MVYSIVTLLYILIAGTPIVDEPLRVNHVSVFKDLAACQEFLTSKEFADQRERLRNVARKAAAEQLSKIADIDDEIPLPDVALTSTCEIDNRL